METRTDGWPVYKTNNITVGNPDSQAAVVTLWTPINHVVEQLDPQAYAVIGHLYGFSGISYLARNMLANTHMRDLIVCGNDITKSGEALMSFWRNGIDDTHRVVGEDMARLHREIPKDALDRLRANVTIHDLRKYKGNARMAALRDCISGLPKQEAWGQAEVFPIAKIENVRQLPTEPGAHVVSDETVGLTLLRVLKDIMIFGEDAGTIYGNVARDLNTLVAVVTSEDPTNFKHEPWFNFRPGDITDYVKEFMTHRIPKDAFYGYGNRLLNYPDHAQRLYIAYRDFIRRNYGITRLPSKFEFDDKVYDARGRKTVDQAEIMVQKLKRTSNDRGSIAILYDPIQDNQINSAHHLEGGFRNPCSVLVQATVKDGKLLMTSYFRSNDMFGAWPRNAFGLRYLQGWMADQLDLPLGPLTTISERAHVYNEFWPEADEILKNYGRLTERFIPDPRGNILLALTETGELLATHTTSSDKGSEPLGDISVDGKEDLSGQALVRQILSQRRISSVEHAADIGRQAALLEIAARFGLRFDQDREPTLDDIAELARKAKEYDQLQTKNQ